MGSCLGSWDSVPPLGSSDGVGPATSSTVSRGRLATVDTSRAVADLGKRDVSCGTSDASDMDGGIVSYMEPEAGTSASACSSVFMAKGDGLFGLFVICHSGVSCVERRQRIVSRIIHLVVAKCELKRMARGSRLWTFTNPQNAITGSTSYAHYGFQKYCLPIR